MDIIEFLGNLLAEKIQKPVLASKGLIRLSIRDLYGDSGKTLTYEVTKKILDEALKNRLEKINIPNASKIIQELGDTINNNRALFTIVTV